MTYEEKITEIGDYDVIIRTPIDITNETKQEEFKFLAEKLRNILKQIELHEDYESLLADKKRLEKISDILIDKMQDETSKINDIAREFNEKTEEQYPWF